MDIVYRHIEFVTLILSIVTSLLSIITSLLSIDTLLLSIVASMLSHVHHRIARPLGPPYQSSSPPGLTSYKIFTTTFLDINAI